LSEARAQDSILYKPIGYVSSPFKQKFAIPRQPNLVAQAQGELVLTKAFTDVDALRELEQFSHIWLLFHFHETESQGWTPTVKPPRLGGKTKVGVFASRSPFRPNSIGMSVVENLGYKKTDNKVVLKLGGIDLLDGTPVLDIKPYIPYADSLPDACGGFAESPPGEDFEVSFSAAAEASIAENAIDYPSLRDLIKAILKQDPRPAWRVREDDNKRYGMSLYDFNIKWTMTENGITVLSIERESAAS